MTRAAARAVLVVGFVALAATLGVVSWFLIVVGYIIAVMGAEKLSIFVFGCALVPILALGYFGRTFADWWRERPVSGRLGAADSALDTAASSIHHARRTLHKHQADKRREYLAS
jgi:hypothetical protein